MMTSFSSSDCTAFIQSIRSLRLFSYVPRISMVMGVPLFLQILMIRCVILVTSLHSSAARMATGRFYSHLRNILLILVRMGR